MNKNASYANNWLNHSEADSCILQFLLVMDILKERPTATCKRARHRMTSGTEKLTRISDSFSIPHNLNVRLIGNIFDSDEQRTREESQHFQRTDHRFKMSSSKGQFESGNKIEHLSF